MVELWALVLLSIVVGQGRLIRILEVIHDWNLLRTLCVMSTGVDKSASVLYYDLVLALVIYHATLV